MRKISLSLAVACAVLAVCAAGSADAMTMSTPAAVKAAVEHSNVVEQVQVVCRRVRRCNAAGYCWWRKVCRVW